MKVLIVANAFPKFSETFVRDHAVSLLKKGLNVTLLVEEIDANEIKSLDGLESFELMNRTISINSLLPKSPFSKLVKGISRITLLGSDDKMSFKGFFNSCLRLGLRKTIHNVFILEYIKSKNIDLVHCHYGNNGERMAFLKGYGLKLFTTFHGYDIRAGLEQGRTIYEHLLKSGTPVISISPFNKKSLKSIGFEDSRILDIANGVDTDFFNANQERSITSKSKIITVARLSPEKGLDIAMRALKMFLDHHHGISLEYTIVGEGKSRKKLEALITELQLEQIVRLVGAKSSQETRDLLIGSDLFILPSRAEASPTVILEAQSTGLPIIATNVGSVSNMVKNGIIVLPDNISDFKRGLETMFNQKEQWPTMGQQGRDFVTENHSLDNQMDSLIEAYNNYEWS